MTEESKKTLSRIKQRLEVQRDELEGFIAETEDRLDLHEEKLMEHDSKIDRLEGIVIKKNNKTEYYE